MKLADVMRDELSEEQILGLTHEERVLWLSRPRPEMDSVKRWMFARVALVIIPAVIACMRGPSSLRWVTFLLITYEIAYYILRQEKAAQDYRIASDEYRERVKSLAHTTVSDY